MLEGKTLNQEINLFRHFKSKPVAPYFLSWERFLLYVLLVTLVFICMTIYSLWALHSLRDSKATALKNISALQIKFYQLKSHYPAFFFTQDINQSINQLQTELTNQEKIFASIVNRTVFSQDLLALSRTIVPNVWLTEINITKDGNDIVLKGKSIAADNLQQFINNLSHEKTFANFNINLKNIENPANASNPILTFEINLVKKAA